MTEKELLAAVRQIAQTTGWLDYHTWRSTHSPAGYPDLTLVRPPRIIFAELKAEKGRLTQHQAEWLTELSRCPGVETYLWRPADLDQIGRILSSRYRDPDDIEGAPA